MAKTLQAWLESAPRPADAWEAKHALEQLAKEWFGGEYPSLVGEAVEGFMEHEAEWVGGFPQLPVKGEKT